MFFVFSRNFKHLPLLCVLCGICLLPRSPVWNNICHIYISSNGLLHVVVITCAVMYLIQIELAL